ncbi:TM2 domain-containing protein [Kocuria sp.]|uniref:TM2 domain-containing protein n=1 Tax=Kocuria sp. TaxID=1871328 RepID=UPI0026DCA9D6|nr:TM2 domain-containing protein [Kocuria sp.]MDO4919101.1 TM2 domain-containing protein [Kocuria sp.]
MAEEPEYYRAQPLPPRDGASQGYQHQSYQQRAPFGAAGSGAQWDRPRRPEAPMMVNVVGGRSALLAYVLWFFLGQLGVHKFYLAQPFQGLLYLILGGLGWATVGIFIGWFFLIPLWLLLVVDLFVIPLRVAVLNARLAYRTGGY